MLDNLATLLDLYDTDPDSPGLASIVRAASNPAHLTVTEIQEFVARWHNRTDPGTFWADLEASPPTANPPSTNWNATTLAALERAMQIIQVAGQHKPTASAFQGAYGVEPASWLAEIGLSGWKASGLIGGMADSDLPEHLVGTTLAERRDEWAEEVFRRAELSWPSAAVRGEMARYFDAQTGSPVLGTDDMQAVHQFIKDSRHRITDWQANLTAASPDVEFDFQSTFVPSYLEDYSYSNPDLEADLRALQRLFAVIPWVDGWTSLEDVWLAGYRSAKQISRTTRERFVHNVEAVASGVSPSRATLAQIWARARSRAQRAGSVYRRNHPSQTGSESPYTDSGTAGQGAGELLRTAPVEDISALYNLARLGCNHCESALSPAAYLVDTILWLQGIDPRLYDELKARRPDLEKLELDCKNTHTLLPYADLVIEILEQVVSGGLENLPTGTERNTEDLRTYPEHVGRPDAKTAYGALQTRHHPRTMPYHLALDEVRTYLGHAGVSHGALLDEFGPLAGGGLVTGERAMLGLGGTKADLDAFTNGTFDSNLASFWQSAVDRERLELLMQRAQLDDLDQVLDLLRTRYLNGGKSRVGVYIRNYDDGSGVDNMVLKYDTATTLPGEAEDLVEFTSDADGRYDWWFKRLAAFLRLQHITGWTALTLDKALHALGVPQAAPGPGDPKNPTDPAITVAIGAGHIEDLWAMHELLRLTGLSPEALFSWWNGLDTYRDRSSRQGRKTLCLYDRVFLDPTVFDAGVESAFQLNDNRDAIQLPAGETSLKPVSHYAAQLSAAFGITEGQFYDIESYLASEHALTSLLADIQWLDETGITEADRGLWHMYRWASLSRAAGLTIVQIDAWSRMTGSVGAPAHPFPANGGEPTAALGWFQALERLRAHHLDVGPIAWVFGHLDSATYGPTSEANERLLGAIAKDIQALDAELAETISDEATMRAALAEAGVLQATIDDLMQIVAWEWLDETAPSEAAITATFLDLGPAVDDPGTVDPNTGDLIPGTTEQDLVLDLSDGPVSAKAFTDRLGTLYAHMQPQIRARQVQEIVFTHLEGAYPAMTRQHQESLSGLEFSSIASPSDLIGLLDVSDPTGTSVADIPNAHHALQIVAKLAYLTRALAMDANTLQEWLLDPDVVIAPDLTAIPLAANPMALEGLWSTLEPALAWFDLDRLFPRTTSAGPEIRQAMRLGAAKTAFELIGTASGLDLAPLGGLIQEMEPEGASLYAVASLQLHDSATQVTIVVDGEPFSGDANQVTGVAAPAGVLVDLANNINSGAGWLNATKIDGNGDPATSDDETVEVRLHTSDTMHTPFDVQAPAFIVQQNLRDSGLFAPVLRRWGQLAALGVHVDTALQWVTSDPNAAAATDARRTAKARERSEKAWHKVGQELRDQIRRRQQNALLTYVRTLPGAVGSDSEFYLKYLVDPMMDPCMQTSRLKLAISSVQSFVNLCFLGKVDVPVDGDPNQTEVAAPTREEEEEDWRSWRSSYRMWEAARKVLMFSENWLTPSVRLEKSPEFAELETSLQVQGLNNRAAEQSFRRYVVDVARYTNPMVACVTRARNGNMHMLARTASEYEIPIYRSGTKVPDRKHAWRWSAWETLPFPLKKSGRLSRLAMYALGDQVILAWVELEGHNEKFPPPDDDQDTDSDQEPTTSNGGQAGSAGNTGDNTVSGQGGSSNSHPGKQYARELEQEDIVVENEDGTFSGPAPDPEPERTTAGPFFEWTYITLNFSIRHQGEWSAPRVAAKLEAPIPVDLLDIQMYEVGGASEVAASLWSSPSTGYVPVGLYAMVSCKSAAWAMLWSPTLQTFVVNEKVSMLIWNTRRQGLLQTGRYGEENSIAFVAYGDSRVVYRAENGQHRFRCPVPEDDVRLPIAGAADPLPGTKLDSGDLKYVLNRSSWSDRHNMVFPANYSEWAGQAPFVVQYDPRSFLIWYLRAGPIGVVPESTFVALPLHSGLMPKLMRELDEGGLEAFFGVP